MTKRGKDVSDLKPEKRRTRDQKKYKRLRDEPSISPSEREEDQEKRSQLRPNQHLAHKSPIPAHEEKLRS